MSIGRQIAHNTIINLVGKFLSLALGLVSVGLMTRYLGQTGFGYYITATAFLQFFGILVDFGISLTTVQLISRPGVDQAKIMNAILSLRVISSFIFLALAPLMVLLFPYATEIKLGVLIIAFSYFCSSVLQTLNGFFQQRMKMMQITLAEVFGRIALVAFVGLAVYFKLNIYYVFAGVSASGLLNLLLIFVFSRKLIKWRWQIDLKIWQEVLKKTWPIALSISFNLLYLRMDTIFLSLTHPAGVVGLYGATYRVIDILTMLPAVFMGIVLPVASAYFADKKVIELKNLLQKSFDVLMICALPIVFGTFLLSQKIMVFIAGAEFAGAGVILNILIIACLPIFISTLFGYSVVAVEKQKSMMWGYLTAAILTLAGYLIFIPKFGAFGAAWMTVFSEAFVSVWTSLLIYKVIQFSPKIKIIFPVLLATAAMLLVLFFVKELPVLLQVLIAIMVYFPFLYVFGGLDKGTIKTVLKLKS